jgi:hypothetical protein
LHFAKYSVQKVRKVISLLESATGAESATFEKLAVARQQLRAIQRGQRAIRKLLKTPPTSEDSSFLETHSKVMNTVQEQRKQYEAAVVNYASLLAKSAGADELKKSQVHVEASAAHLKKTWSFYESNYPYRWAKDSVNDLFKSSIPLYTDGDAHGINLGHKAETEWTKYTAKQALVQFLEQTPTLKQYTTKISSSTGMQTVVTELKQQDTQFSKMISLLNEKSAKYLKFCAK